MIQPVSAVAFSPPATVAPQDTSVSGQVEVSLEALPSPSAAQVSQFGEFIKTSRIDEVTLQSRPFQGAATSKIGAAINGAMKHLSEFEARARLEVPTPHEGPAGQALSHSRGSATDTDDGHLLANSVGVHAQFSPEAAPERLSIKDVADYQRQAAQSTMMVMEFEIESTVYSKVAEKSGAAINQLVQEK